MSLEEDEGGLFEVPDITAAADERFLRMGSAPTGGSGLRIFLVMNMRM